MRYSLLCFFILFLFSCDDKTVGENKNVPATNEEESLKNDAKKYPDSLQLIQNLAGYYTDKENYSAALSTINDALKKDSTNPYLWDMQSMVYMQKEDTIKAINSLNKAIEILPDPQYIISLGALYAQTRNPIALDVADALIVGNKAKAEKEAYFIKGLYFSFINEKEKAIPFFDKCINLNYTFMNAYLEKGIALYDLTKYKEAADVLEKAVTLQNNFSQGYYYLGKCYEKLNRTNDAIDAYNTAVIRDQNYAEAIEALNRLGVK
jgi:tetratricopeptide (TPR) repeat protein